MLLHIPSAKSQVLNLPNRAQCTRPSEGEPFRPWALSSTRGNSYRKKTNKTTNPVSTLGQGPHATADLMVRENGNGVST
jgi:hypothetical protein